MPVFPVDRPVLSLLVSRQSDDRQQALPDDTIELWAKFAALTAEDRKQFVQVATMWQASLSLRREHPTSSFTLMVASCEALKPRGKEFRDRNIYHVIEALLGRPQADALRRGSIGAHQIRSDHIHTGELHGAELEPRAIMSTFSDPSFMEASDALWLTVSAAITEWLRRGGNCPTPIPDYRRRARRFTQQGLAAILALSLAIVLGWILHSLLH
jgi:hypothetical protein